MSKQKTMLALTSVILAVFTVVNVIDFCRAETHSTTAYLAVALNFIAIVELIQLFWKVRTYGKEK